MNNINKKVEEFIEDETVTLSIFASNKEMHQCNDFAKNRSKKVKQALLDIQKETARKMVIDYKMSNGLIVSNREIYKQLTGEDYE